MIIRQFEVRDVGPACRLTNHYIQTSPAHFGCRPMPEAEFSAMWESGSKTYPWLAAEVDAHFAGYAKAGVWRAREAYARTAEVGIYVEPAAHGRGLGRSLYADLIRRVKETGFHTIVAGVTLPNEASVRLHESLGFRQVGTFREVGHKFDRWHDTGWWQLMLE